MNNWTVYVEYYRLFVILCIVCGLAMLFAALLIMRKFHYRKTFGKTLYFFLYGLSNTDLICLSAGTCRLLLVVALLVTDQSLRLSHLVSIGVLTALLYGNGKDAISQLKGFLLDGIQMVVILVGLFLYGTLNDYARQMSAFHNLTYVSLMLAIFIVLYSVILLLQRLPGLGHTQPASHNKENANE